MNKDLRFLILLSTAEMVMIFSTFCILPYPYRDQAIFSDNRVTTYGEQLNDFLSTDNTSKIEYNETFKCVQFSEMLQKHGLEYDLHFQTVILWFNNTNRAHELCSIDIEEIGTVFVEPQSFETYGPDMYATFISNYNITYEYEMESIHFENGTSVDIQDLI